MIPLSVLEVSPKENIIIKGAKLHNLKNIDVVIPRNKLVVVTGLSGSGKSSLAFDTLYAEGQRRYVESLSSYARQFLGKLDKPEVEYIKGIAPAIAIEQKVISRNPRSTVGTSTEIYDYMKVLFARIGKTYSPISGTEVKKYQSQDVLDYIKGFPVGTRFYINAPLNAKDRTLGEHFKILQQQGFARLDVNGEILRIEDILDGYEGISSAVIKVVIDRAVADFDEENLNRLSDSIETAFYEGHGELEIKRAEDGYTEVFNNKFEADGMLFEEPSIHLFSFNNPYGACPKCEGFGSVIGVDEDLVVPNQNLSIYEDAVVAWRGESMSEWKTKFIKAAHKVDFPIHRPYFQLTDEERDFLWHGDNKSWKGLDSFFRHLEAKTYKIQFRVMLARYRGKTKCPECKGTRLRKEASYVKIGGKAIQELVNLPIDELQVFFANLQLNTFDGQVSKRLLTEINNRIFYLTQVGLSYLTLNRISNTLSGGESQRINLATSLGSSLVGSMYILDEPSIGLHPKDTEKLIQVIKRLRDLGNTVIVVEHDEEIMKAADQIIDIGPGAGSEGGSLLYNGSFEGMKTLNNSLTADYLFGNRKIALPEKRRDAKFFIEIIGGREQNLKNITAKFPTGCLSVVTGVSGSGKSTLVHKILYAAINEKFLGYNERPGKFTEITGEGLTRISGVEFVDQNPIGKSSRSNPVTYLKVYDEIRNLYASQKLAKHRNYKSGHFSFNTDGGRCDTCQGEGTVTIEMQFMADVHLKCEDCDGQRFKKEVLEVKFEDKNIFEILEMTVDDAISFFQKHKKTKVADKLQPLQDTGLGYIKLGQSSSTDRKSVV